MKELIEKRNALIAQYDALKQTLEVEKRSAYNTQEREAVNKIKLDIAELDARIADEKEMTEKRNAKLDDLATVNVSTTSNKNLVTEFRSFLNGDSRTSGDKFTVPFGAFEKRATVTTSTNSHFSFVDQHAGLSIADSDLVLPALGVKTYYFDSGAVDFPAISEIVGSFGLQDSSVSDQTLSSAKRTLTPSFVSASIEVSKVFLKSSKPENIQNLMGELKYAVDKALEKRTIDSMGSLTPIASGATSIVTTFHNATLQMEKALVGTPSGYIFSATGVAKAKNSKVDSGSGILVWKDGYVNGYPAKRSTLMSGATTNGYLISSSAVGMAYWGEGISIEVISDATLARKGNVLLIASALADGSYLDANKIAVIKNVDKLT